MAKSPAIARRYAVVHLKLGGRPHLPQLTRTNQEQFVADWEARRGSEDLLEVAFVWLPGPKLQFALINRRPAKVLLATGRKRLRLLARGPHIALGTPAFAFSNIDEVGVACLGNDNSGSNDQFVSPTQSAEDREIDIVVRKC